MKPILMILALTPDEFEKIAQKNRHQWQCFLVGDKARLRSIATNHLAVSGAALKDPENLSLLRLFLERGKRYIGGCHIYYIDPNNPEGVVSCGHEVTAAHKRIQELETLINTPLVDNFIKALPLEAAHQQERWGTDHDVGKTQFDWIFLIGHLATRAAMKFTEGNREKALHHTITTAAVCLNWHRHMQGELTRFRPGTDTTESES